MVGQEVDITVLTFGTMGMLVMALALVAFIVLYQKKRINQQVEQARIENEYQRQLLNSTIEVREKEQKRIALELHDDIGSTLNGIKMKLSKRDITELEIADVRNLLKDVVKQVRDISHDLLPPVLNELGLNGAIKNLCRRFMEQTAITVEYDIPFTKFEGLKQEEELAIYRIVQELLNNIAKHARAKNVEVNIITTAKSYQVVISDDGIGFTPPAKHDVSTTSLGLKNIASRVQQINAQLKYEKKPQNGTTVTLKCSL